MIQYILSEVLKMKRFLALFLSVILLLCCGCAKTQTPVSGSIHVYFIDVGQGDCSLVTYNGQAVLIDAGPRSSGYSTAEYVWTYAETIDYFIITHPHEDHIGGAIDILEKCDVECLIIPEDVSPENFYRDTLRTAERLGVEIVTLEGASTYILDGITVEIADNSGLVHDDLNNASLFVKVTAGSTTCLFTGDAEYEAELYAVQHYG